MAAGASPVSAATRRRSAVSCELCITSSAWTDGASSSPSAAWMPPCALAVLDDARPSLVASSTRAPASRRRERCRQPGDAGADHEDIAAPLGHGDRLIGSPRMDVRWHEAERDGTRLACADYGGAGPPALLLHGLAGHAREWDSTAAWLARSHRVVAPDGRAARAQRASPRRRLAGGLRRSTRSSGSSCSARRRPWSSASRSAASPRLLLAARQPRPRARPRRRRGDAGGDPDAVGAVRRWLASWPLPFPSDGRALAFFGGDTLRARAWTSGLERRADGLWPAFEPGVLAESPGRCRSAELLGRVGEHPLSRAHRSGVRRRAPRRGTAHGRLKPGARLAEIEDAGHDVHLDQPERWRSCRASWRAPSLTLGRGLPRRNREGCVKSVGPSLGESDRAARANAMQMPSQHPPSVARPSASSRSTVRPGRCGADWHRSRAICPRRSCASTPTRRRREVRSASDLAASAGAAVAWIPEAAPVALAELLAQACPDVVLDSALCGDELVGALLDWTSVCDLADLRTDPWRVAIALGSEGEGALDGLDGVDVLGRGADARRLADWLAAGVKVPVWVVGDETGIQGVRLRYRQRTSASCRRPRWRRARRSATRSISSPAGTSSCARCRARQRASAAPTADDPLSQALSARASPGCSACRRR